MPRGRKGDGGLYETSRGIWVGQVDVPTTDGKRKRMYVSSKDRGKAAAKLDDLKKAITKGQVAQSPKVTVEQWLKHWLETIVKPEVRPKTYLYYEQTVRLHIVPHIGS